MDKEREAQVNGTRKFIMLISVAGISMLSMYHYAPSLAQNVAGVVAKAGYGYYGNSKTRQGGVRELDNPDIMIKRHKILQQRCKELRHKKLVLRKGELYNKNFIVNDKYKLIYCFIPKIACTNLKRVFLLLTGKMKTLNPMDLKHNQVHGVLQTKYLLRLPMYNRSEIASRIANYTKILFVREPFERLLSAYRNKFGPDGEKFFKLKYGRYIVEHFRENASSISLKRGGDVRFTEFVQYLIAKKNLDIHWMRYTDLCHPCEVDYDFIGTFESLEQDVDTLLDKIGVSDFIHFPSRNESYERPKTSDVMYDFYKRVTRKDIVKLKEMYEDDMYLFGYELPGAIRKLLKGS